MLGDVHAYVTDNACPEAFTVEKYSKQQEKGSTGDVELFSRW